MVNIGPEEVAVQVSRQDALEVLSRVPISSEVREQVLALPFPMELRDLIKAVEPFGISRDWLIDTMGGSP